MIFVRSPFKYNYCLGQIFRCILSATGLNKNTCIFKKNNAIEIRVLNWGHFNIFPSVFTEYRCKHHKVCTQLLSVCE